MRNLFAALAFLALAAVTLGVFFVDRMGPRLGADPGLSLEVPTIRNDENRVVLTVGRGEFDPGITDPTAERPTPTTPRDIEDRVLGRGTSTEAEEDDIPVDPTTGRRMVTVLKGETLREIARKHLGDAARYPEILKLNPRMKRPEDLREGQVLVLPPRRGDAR